MNNEIYLIRCFDTPITTTMRIMMLDRSIKSAVRVLFDVLMKVDRFIHIVDFIMLDSKIDQEIVIILGRPFLAARRAVDDIEKG